MKNIYMLKVELTLSHNQLADSSIMIPTSLISPLYLK